MKFQGPEAAVALSTASTCLIQIITSLNQVAALSTLCRIQRARMCTLYELSSPIEPDIFDNYEFLRIIECREHFRNLNVTIFCLSPVKNRAFSLPAHVTEKFK
ncbi:hypothetical protein HHI36_021721 [Cryptolaemus montrouzieri]|uniref:Uncharacterized protein n=1 Tax=Cryptolaemus montrouzieri TaxID=559131 RepID=A0ABD2MYL8_9CUCU